MMKDYYEGDGPRPFGGSLPIKVNGAFVGTVTTSGDQDYVDHEVLVEGARRFLASL